MRFKAFFQSAALTLLSICISRADGIIPTLSVEEGHEVIWSTTLGNTYQLQSAPSPTGPWSNLGADLPGDGNTQSHCEAPPSSLHYQVLETIPGTDPTPTNPVNGGFELGTGAAADHWSTAANQPPTRTAGDAHTGSFSMRCALNNIGSTPSEGLLEQLIVDEGGTITPGQSYDFSFWIKQISVGPSYVQQYEVQWLNASNAYLGGPGLQTFNGVIDTWTEISVPSLVAPAGAAEARIKFRFVTGAVSGGHGEVLIDDVALDDGTGGGPGTPPTVNTIPLTPQPVIKVSWPSTNGVSYQPETTTNFSSWIPLPAVLGNGSTQTFTVPQTNPAEFYRLGLPEEIVAPPSNLQTPNSGPIDSISLTWTASTTPGVTGYRVSWGLSGGTLDNTLTLGNVTNASIPSLTTGQLYDLAVVAFTPTCDSAPATTSALPIENTGIISLFDASTPLEAPTTVDTPNALITYIADRARDRHAREGNFHSYDHYLSWYWEQRIANLEIIDRVGRNGGNDITFNYSIHDQLNPAEFRTFFRGLGTVAEYHSNQIATLVSTTPSSIPGETDYNYSATIDLNHQYNRALQVGDRVEIELSQFLLAPRNGRNNYYGTTMLYIVGQGIVPWASGEDLGLGAGIVNSTNTDLDSHPLPVTAWLGGQTTLPYQYSNEPEHRFKQTAGNISPTSGHPFMLGRRLHHTDFGNGVHSEPMNPIFTTHIGKLGRNHIARSCVECHTNNGRALPPALSAPMFKSVTRVGTDANGSPHPTLGSVLQPQATTGTVEGSAIITSYTNTPGTYGDSTPYTLQKPNYTFSGPTPSHFSSRLAPQLVGLGLLEAIDEATITALADPTDSNADGISGRIQTVTDPETGEQRLGRFGAKAGKARLSHQVAAALNTDMGITTSLFPILDGESTAGAQEISDTELDQMTRYVALLGVAAQRDLSDPDVILGKSLFTTADCVKCHTPTLTTGAFHPYTELRNQTIHPYTDLLLHDMGPGLADNMGEADASGSEWRTPPLWNIGLTSGVSGGEAYLHDGRARSLEEAILWHGGEAESSKENFRTMQASDRSALIKFLKSL